MSAVDTTVSREAVARIRDRLREVAAEMQVSKASADSHGRGIAAGLNLSADQLDRLLGEDTRPESST